MSELTEPPVKDPKSLLSSFIDTLFHFNYYYRIMPNINEEFGTLFKSNGASLVGFADLREIDEGARDSYPFGISFAIALNPQIIAEINEGPTKPYVEEVQRADSLLEKLGQAAAQFLIKKGSGNHLEILELFFVL